LSRSGVIHSLCMRYEAQIKRPIISQAVSNAQGKKGKEKREKRKEKRGKRKAVEKIIGPVDTSRSLDRTTFLS